jgi:hypothetical protein
MRENEIAAEAMGIAPAYKVRAFTLAAFFAGIAGALFAHEIGTTLNPRELGFPEVVRHRDHGRARRHGLDVGHDWWPPPCSPCCPSCSASSPSTAMIVYALALIVVMLVRPQGLFGLREVWELGIWRSCGAPKAGGRRERPSWSCAGVSGVVRRPEGGHRLLAVAAGRRAAGPDRPNGAGKTTVFNLLTGVYSRTPARSGSAASRMVGRRPAPIAAPALARTFQNIRLFGT